MIYFADEEFNRIRSKLHYLTDVGQLEVKHLRDAEVAYNTLISADDIELIIIDVMFAAGGRYDREKTDGYSTTGLLLVRDLLVARPDIPASRIVLFSSATRQDIVGRIRTMAKEDGVQYRSKSDFSTPSDFLAYVQALLQQ